MRLGLASDWRGALHVPLAVIYGVAEARRESDPPPQPASHPALASDITGAGWGPAPAGMTRTVVRGDLKDVMARLKSMGI